MVRAQILQALRLPASETSIVYCSFFHAGPAPSETAGGKFVGRAQAFPLRLSASALGLHRYQHPTRLTIRSSRPHVVASATCFCATLARVRRPATGRLNSGVRRQRAFGSCAVNAATCPLRSALLFGRFLGTLLLRSSPFGALTLRIGRVARLGKRRSSSASFPRLTRGFGHHQLEVCGARSIAQASVFGQLGRSSASRGSVPPNKSFKPTPCRGVGHVLYATLAHVRRPATGRLNSGVRPHFNHREISTWQFKSYPSSKLLHRIWRR